MQSYHDERPKTHDGSNCKGKLTQIFSVPAAYIGPQTIGSLAEKNTKGMSDDARRHYTEQVRTKKVRTHGRTLGRKADLNKVENIKEVKSRVRRQEGK